MKIVKKPYYCPLCHTIENKTHYDRWIRTYCGKQDKTVRMRPLKFTRLSKP